MDRGQERIADELVVKGQKAGQLVPAPVEPDAEELDVRHTLDQRGKCGVAALFHHLDGFGALAGHGRYRSTVKAPAALATGRSRSSSKATARTKATDRVT